MSRPYRAHIQSSHMSQGLALGWYGQPFQGMMLTSMRIRPQRPVRSVFKIIIRIFGWSVYRTDGFGWLWIGWFQLTDGVFSINVSLLSASYVSLTNRKQVTIPSPGMVKIVREWTSVAGST